MLESSSDSVAPARPAVSLPPVRANTGAFVDHLLALHASQQSGVMSVHADGSVIDVYLRRGVPVFAERDTLAGSLGRSLLEDGTLSGDQYERVVGEMTKTVFDSEAMCLAEVVVQLGYLDHQSVNERLEQHVRRTIMDCMRWVEPEVEFLAGSEASLVASYPCPVPPLVLAGVKAHYDMQRCEDVWRPNGDTFAELSRPPGDTAKLYAMKPNELRYVSSIDGTARIEDLVSRGDLDIVHAGQIIAALLLTDGLRLFADAVETGVESMRPISSVPVVSDAVRRRMSSPMLQAVRQPTPAIIEGLSAPVAAPVVIDAAQIPIPRPIDRPRAQRLFLHGKRFLSSNNLKKALQAFERAVELDPDVPEYELYTEWTRFIKQPPADSRAALERLKELALQTIERDDQVAFAHYVYGRVALARKDHEQARRALKIASRLDPKNEDARRFLRSVSKR